MKRLYFSIICLACLLALGSCGSMRPSSANKKDDQTNSRDSLNTENQRLDHQVRKQSFDLESGGYKQENATGWKPGLLINYDRKRVIRFTIIRETSGRVYRYTIDGGRLPMRVELPIGRYQYFCEKRTNKGFKVLNDSHGILEITNKANDNYNGDDYYFVLSN